MTAHPTRHHPIAPDNASQDTAGVERDLCRSRVRPGASSMGCASRPSVASRSHASPKVSFTPAIHGRSPSGSTLRADQDRQCRSCHPRFRKLTLIHIACRTRRVSSAGTSVCRPGTRKTLLGLLSLVVSTVSLAQTSPFQTGATALQTNLLALLTPVAVILVIGLGVMAMANRIAWGWCIGAIAGIAIAFGAPQIVSWIRGMFGV